MDETRVKQLMGAAGYPESQTIKALIQQVANEVEQGVIARFADPDREEFIEEAQPPWWPEFEERISRRGPDECWPWLGGQTKGYGRFSMGKRNVWRHAHRVAWELVNGEIPEGMLICHHCDNPICVNPAHLYAGTYKDNSSDMVKRGRQNPVRGSANHSAKLTEEQVLEIRERYISRSQKNGCRALGREFGVDHSVISEIISRQKWSHI